MNPRTDVPTGHAVVVVLLAVAGALMFLAAA